MNLAKDLFHQIAAPSLTRIGRAELCCQLAKQLEGVGNYEGAREAMGALWPGVGERPVLDDLDQQTAAEVLLRAGTLTGWIGSARQLKGAQELAKNLIGESKAIFEALGNEEKVAEAQTDLAHCYWREGALNSARALLQEALSFLGDKSGEAKAIALLRLAIVERSAKRFNDALRIHKEAAPLFKTIQNDVLQGKFHHGFANVLNYLISAEYREDYVDQALLEYTAASFYFEQAGLTRYQAYVENNFGFLFSTIGKFAEAHEHLDRAQALFTTLKDSGHLAQVDETRARVLLAEGQVAEAQRLVRSAVRTLERGGEQSLLGGALTTHGVALARLGRHEEARATLRRALEVAEQAGDQESAGQAALTIIEESGPHLPAEELSAAYERAAELLAGSQNLATFKRLCACARRVLFLTHASPAPPGWEGFSFREAVRRYESSLIERALRDAGGLVTRAAQLLGFNNHQSLIYVLKSRHKQLLHARLPPMPRRRSIIRPRGTQPTPDCRAEDADAADPHALGDRPQG
jgi:tetratricopeptide (TPR) repeat protein